MLSKVRPWEAKILRLTFRARMSPSESRVNYRIGTAKSLRIKWKKMGLPLLTEKNSRQNLDDFGCPNHEGIALDSGVEDHNVVAKHKCVGRWRRTLVTLHDGSTNLCSTTGEYNGTHRCRSGRARNDWIQLMAQRFSPEGWRDNQSTRVNETSNGEKEQRKEEASRRRSQETWPPLSLRCRHVHHTTMNLNVGLKKTRLILFDDFFVLLLVPDGPGLRWMFSDAVLLQTVLTVPSAIGKMKFSPFIAVSTSFALSLRAWSSDASICSNSSMSATTMSPFQIHPAYNTYPRNIPGKTLGTN